MFFVEWETTLQFIGVIGIGQVIRRSSSVRSFQSCIFEEYIKCCTYKRQITSFTNELIRCKFELFGAYFRE